MDPRQSDTHTHTHTAHFSSLRFWGPKPTGCGAKHIRPSLPRSNRLAISLQNRTSNKCWIEHKWWIHNCLRFVVGVERRASSSQTAMRIDWFQSHCLVIRIDWAWTLRGARLTSEYDFCTHEEIALTHDERLKSKEKPQALRLCEYAPRGNVKPEKVAERARARDPNSTKKVFMCGMPFVRNVPASIIYSKSFVYYVLRWYDLYQPLPSYRSKNCARVCVWVANAPGICQIEAHQIPAAYSVQILRLWTDGVDVMRTLLLM